MAPAADELKLDLRADKIADRMQPPASFRERPPSARRCTSAHHNAVLSTDGLSALQQAASTSQLFERLYARLDKQAEETRHRLSELRDEMLHGMQAQKEELAAQKAMLELFAQVCVPMASVPDPSA